MNFFNEKPKCCHGTPLTDMFRNGQNMVDHR